MSLRGLSSTQKGRVGLRGQVWADGDLTASLFFFWLGSWSWTKGQSLNLILPPTSSQPEASSMGWPEMLVLPNIQAWDFLLADLVFFRKAKDTKHVSRMNPVAGGVLFDVCSWEALPGITVLNALDEEGRLQGCPTRPRSRMV